MRPPAILLSALLTTTLAGLVGCSAGVEPEIDCEGARCDALDDPNADSDKATYESGYYDVVLASDFSVTCVDGDVDPASIQPGLDALIDGGPPLEDGPLRIVRLLDTLLVEGEPCDTDGASFQCAVASETVDHSEHGFVMDILGVLEGEWSAPGTIAIRGGAEMSCTGESCAGVAEVGGLIGRDGTPRNFPCFLGWNYEATFMGHDPSQTE